jgi:DNA primase|tara:strand:- start:213 stop:1157 length:945 start_codon:yes stop_codon:yes gene_type:complete
MHREKLKIVASCLGEYRTAGNETLFYCPFCKHHKHKLSVNVSANVYKCWICDAKGKNVRRLIRKFGNYGMVAEWDKLTGRHDISDFDNIFSTNEDDDVIIQRVNLPDEFRTLTKDSLSPATLPAVNYLRARGIGKKEILEWKIGYCPSGEYAGRIIIPSFDTEGYVNYFIARSYDGAWMRYKNPQASRDIVFNELYLDWDDDIVLVEGVFDAIVAGNAIPILGSTLNNYTKVFSRLISEGPKVYLALDSDATYKEHKIIKNLLQYDMELHKIDTADIEDVGAITREEFAARKAAAKRIEDSSYILSDALSSIRI